MNKIVSNFYLIKVGGEPSYVGYTNRPIKTRFNEHKRDKDFGDELVELESLGSLEYDFTWDEELISRYAKEVSDKENELIIEYDTKDTVWQKGTSGSLGGQTWNDVKYFVKTNRDNPKFRDMQESDIIEYLEKNDRVSRYIRSFVNHMDDPVAVYMRSFVNHMDDPVSLYMRDFVGNMNDPVYTYMKNFVGNMDDPISSYMKNFVNHIEDPVAAYMKNFVNHMEDPVAAYTRNFVHNMDDPVSVYMHNFIVHMDDPVTAYLRNFVRNLTKPADN